MHPADVRNGAQPVRRFEAYPSLAARDHWAKYAAGMFTEILFISAVALIGLLIAVSAMVVYQ